MDQFGIGAAVSGAAECIFMAGRRTGRTTQLIESVKDGDRIIFSNPKEAERVRRLVLERGVEVECVTVPIGDLDLSRLGPSPGDGRTILDHSWVEEFYRQQISGARRSIDEIQGRLSGYGAKHRETRRAAEEHARWMAFNAP